MIKFPNTLSFRLTSWYTVAFISFLLAAFLVLYLAIGFILDERMDEDLKEDILDFRMLSNSGSISKVVKELEREARSNDEGEVFFRLLDIKGNLIFSSDLSQWQIPNILNKALQFKANSKSDPVLETISVLGQEFDTRTAYGFINPNTILHIGESYQNKEEIMTLLFKVFLGLLCVGVPLASGIGWFMARQAVQGIEEISQAVKDIKNGEFNHQVSFKFQRDEIQELAAAVNAMSKRIRYLITDLREITDNIAHDLRSPLARIHTISERMLTGKSIDQDYKLAAVETLEECDRLIQMVNTTLDVAAVEAGIASTPNETINISELIQDACEHYEILAEANQIDLKFKYEPDCILHGNKQNLQRMCANLLENALKYTPQNGYVTVNLTKHPDYIHLTFKDNGIGIPSSDQSLIFERFFRCDKEQLKEGFGLGLSLALAIAHAHKGNINLVSIPNEGSTFTVTLPI